MKKKFILFASLTACISLYIIEQILSVNYAVKTLCKLCLFIIVPLIYIKHIKRTSFKSALNLGSFKIKKIIWGLLLGFFCFVVVLSAYFFLRNYIDLQTISLDLSTKSKITAKNFIFIGLYITFINSFLEEFFFRGFIFLNLYSEKQKKWAYIYSSLLFAFYHIGIFKTWFNPFLVLLALFGLSAVGIIFNWLCTKSENFLNSWIVHALADSAIIIIGLKMFNII